MTNVDGIYRPIGPKSRKVSPRYKQEKKKGDPDDDHTASTVESNSILYSNLTPEEGASPNHNFHPDFMFCGRCTDCQPQPQPDDDNNDNDNNNNTSVNKNKSKYNKLQQLQQTDPTQLSKNAAGPLRTQLLLEHHWKSPHHALVLQSLLQPVAGVAAVHVELNDPTVFGPSGTGSSTNSKQSTVTVHHDACTVDADLLRVLQQGGYPATIVERRYAEQPMGYDELMGRPAAGAAAAGADDSNAVLVVRSTFFVQGICCTSEVPAVRKLVQQLPGVSSLQINITTRRVYVQHDVRVVEASEIATRLTKAGFTAQILVHGSAHTTTGSGAADHSSATSSVGRTTLQSHAAVLHQQDIAKFQRVLIQLQGVKRVGVNLSESVLLIDHDIHTVSAVQIQQALATSNLTASYQFALLQDAQVVLAARTTQLLAQPRSLFVESCLHISNLTAKHIPVMTKVVQQHYIPSTVRVIHPHIASHTCKVEHNPDKVTLEQISVVLKKYGLDAHILQDGGVERHFLPLPHEDTPEEIAAKQALQEWDATSDLEFHVVISGIFWALSLFSAVQDGHGVWGYFEYAGLLSVFFGLPPVFYKAWRTIRRCEFDANCMMVIAALGALVLGELSEAASVSFLFALSEYLESCATRRARIALSEIVKLRPDHANLIHPETKEIVIVPADQVPVGSLISVRTGDKIAADGVVVEGTSSVDESSLTGESVPARKGVDDTVSGGSINIGGTQLVVRTTVSVDDSTVSRLIRLVEEAQANRSPTEKMIDGFARAYTPLVVFLALCMATIPWVWGIDVGRHWTMNALIIIVIACPCALTISTPVTYAAGLAAMAQRGIIVKGGASLEALGSVDKVVLDKTGTITEGKFSVLHMELISKTRDRKTMLELLALMEAPSSHPLSATLVRAARNEGVSVPTDVSVKEHTILKGEGVTAQVSGRTVYVGNKRLFERVGMYDQLGEAHKELADQWSAEGGTVGFLGVEGEGIIGSFCMSDSVRPEARATVRSLRKGGIDVVMLTGDGDGASRAVALQVGIKSGDVHSQLLPEDKLHFIASLKRPAPKNSFGLFRRQPKVLFCGDGVNDGPALAAADIGVSMGEGAALAMEMSDVTLMDSNLSKVVDIIKMGTRVLHTIQENIVLSLVCKLVVVVLTFMGKMTLLYAIASDVGVMLIVTFNGMKLLPGVSSSDIGFSAEYLKMEDESERAPLQKGRIATDSAEIV